MKLNDLSKSHCKVTKFFPNDPPVRDQKYKDKAKSNFCFSYIFKEGIKSSYICHIYLCKESTVE